MGGTYDVVVVGSGPGGATVARDLARGGARVLVVERGRADPPSGRARQALRELFLPGRSLFATGSVLVLRAVTLGGSSMYFFGSAWEPPHATLRAHGVDLRADAAALRAELRPQPLPRDLMARGPAWSSTAPARWAWTPTPSRSWWTRTCCAPAGSPPGARRGGPRGGSSRTRWPRAPTS